MNRLDIIKLASEGIGVEVGVCQGHFSEDILKNWGGILYSVDSWTHNPERFQDPSNVSQEEHDKNYLETINRLAPFKTRSHVLKMESWVAALKLNVAYGPESLDFVYLDAAHDYKSVRDDLCSWFDMVKPGGILAGHDYFNTTKRYRKNIIEVRRAVDNFFNIQQRVVYSTQEKRLPSWYIIK
jgi:hypothetical protein